LRQIIALAGVVLLGSVLFVISRKLVWGREEALTGWARWSLALLPYAAYFCARKYSSSSDRLLMLVKRTDFLVIWTVSLLAFVIMRGSMIAPLYESPIYNVTDPTLLRYAMLSAIYVGFASISVTIWRLTKTNVTASNVVVAPQNVIGLHVISALAAWVLFCSFVFVIAL
jgi:hypothetical protein